MSDPLDGVLDQIDPNATPVATDPVTPPETNTVAIDKEELARLQAIADDPTIRALRENPNLIHDLRAQAINQAAPAAPAEDANTAFWQDPTGQAARIAAQEAAKQNQATNAQLGQMIVNNYKLGKQSSEFYHVCGPIFDKLIQNLNRAQLAQTEPTQVQFILDAAWRSAVGEYTEKRLADRKKNPPTNLGGGGAGGAAAGPKAKKTLAEIDPTSYAMALQAKLSEEEMQAIADQIGGDE